MDEIIVLREYPTIRFVAKNDKLIIETHVQAFFLQPSENYWRKRLSIIRSLIEIGEIQDLDDLSRYCGTVIKWVPTRRINPARSPYEIMRIGV